MPKCDNCGKDLDPKDIHEVVVDGKNLILGVPTNSRGFSKKRYNACSECYSTVDWVYKEDS